MICVKESWEGVSTLCEKTISQKEASDESAKIACRLKSAADVLEAERARAPAADVSARAPPAAAFVGRPIRMLIRLREIASRRDRAGERK
ncbi:hypothetical protein EVAR_84896_1 [Eumeta japonica]|uniref:Uncharacterized protein n=1 Tax=Eumeta variegata TaxID=151549 RepID=A0A4C1YHL7_EUMVA|nr:hypothetical protein EVAR_84896_1 [Eumeta japonica]